jgi:hypothetical protein
VCLCLIYHSNYVLCSVMPRVVVVSCSKIKMYVYMWYVTIKNRNVFTILLLDLCKLNKCVPVWYTLSRYHACEPCIPYIIHVSVCPRFKFGFLCPMFWQIISFSVNMVPRGISEVQILQILTMRSTWISLKANGRFIQ